MATILPFLLPPPRSLGACLCYRRTFRARLAKLLILVFCASSALAHRPSESSADFRWEHERLEVKATFSLLIATMLLGDPDVPMLGSSNFEAARERLTARVAEFFAVHVEGRAVQPTQTIVQLELSGEVTAVILYPPMARGALVVHARNFDRLAPDAFCWLRVWEDVDNLQGQKLLTRGSPRATFPASGKLPETPEPAVPPKKDAGGSKAPPPAKTG